MSFKSLLVCASVVFQSFGWAAQPTFKAAFSADGFENKIAKDLLVVFEISHLQAAFKTTSGGTASDYPIIAGNAVLAQLEKKLALEGVTITKDVIDSTNDRSQLARRIRASPDKKQVLVIQVSSFGNSQRMHYGKPSGSPAWNGTVTWWVRLYDLTTPEGSAGKPSWNVKTNESPFGIHNCWHSNTAHRSVSESCNSSQCVSAPEPYSVCSAELADAISAKLEREDLFAR